MAEKNSGMTTVQQPQRLYQNRRTKGAWQGVSRGGGERKLDKLSGMFELWGEKTTNRH